MVELNELLLRLDGVKKCGRFYRARCPGREDKNPSLSVWEEGGWIKLRDWGGKMDDQDIVRALGLENKDLRTSAPEAVAYTYKDRQGKAWFQKKRIVRDGVKSFYQAGMDGRKNLVSLNGHAKLLYGENHLAKAIEQGQTVYINEGEKACEAFWAERLVATCQPGGADKEARKWLESHTEALRGIKEAVIVADRDEVGEAYAKSLWQKLSKAGIPARVVRPKVEEPKADAFDHFCAGYTVEEFMPAPDLMVDAPKRYTMAAAVEPKKVDWLWEPYIPLGEVTLLAGDPGVGKSTVAQAICTAATHGAKIGEFAVRQGNVLFMSAEQNEDSVTVPRFIEMGADLHKIALPKNIDAQGNPQMFMLDDEGFEVLAEMCAELKPVLVVVDTITAYIESGRDMNTANAVREWMRSLINIGREYGAAILALTHLKKGQGRGNERILGSTDFVGAARSVLQCGANPDDNRDRALVHTKSNVGVQGSALGFSVEAGRFTWTGESELTMERMAEQASPRRVGSRNPVECVPWLKSLLEEKGAVTSNEATELGLAAGFSKNAVWEARKTLEVKSFKDKFGGDGGWVLMLPDAYQEMRRSSYGQNEQ